MFSNEGSVVVFDRKPVARTKHPPNSLGAAHRGAEDTLVDILCLASRERQYQGGVANSSCPVFLLFLAVRLHSVPRTLAEPISLLVGFRVSLVKREGLCHGLLLEVQVRLLAKARPFGILASTFTASVNNSGYRHFVSSQRWRDWRGQATQGERPRGLSQRAPNPY